MPNPISNYQLPGVYVTQSGSSLTSTSPTNLNIAIVADNPVLGFNTDTFYNAPGISGVQVGQLSVPMVINNGYTGTYSTYSGYTVTWTSGNAVVPAAYGVNFSITPGTTTSPFTYITTTGITGTPISGTVQITYGHQWAGAGTYYSYNQVQQAFGSSVSGTTITNPALLASQFAFNNGANTVTILPVARLSTVGSGVATDGDWQNTFSVSSGSTGNNPIYLSTKTGVDVVVPLYGFIAVSGANPGSLISYATNNVAGAISNYLSAQASGGNYQRAFIGVDGTFNLVTTSALQALASGFGNSNASTRVSIVYPGSINFSPNINATATVTNVNFNIPGYYLAAAAAGLFVGQPSVATPITNKVVNGFNYVPNQISLVDAATNFLPYGITTVFQKRDGNLWVLQGLTTNTTNWLTQEISLNAIGDVLAKRISNGLQSTSLIGGPLTANTASAALGEVQGQLTNAVSNGLIQSYQNLAYSVNPNAPTTVNITFQYSPTYPINYIQVTLSLNTQTGQVIESNSQSNLVVY